MHGGPAIEARALVKRYGDHVALAGVSFAVEFGEVFAYLGRNGSGKTTTVRILTGLSAATSGHGCVAGSELGRIDRSRIGLTMQDASLDDSMTGLEHLEFIAGLWGLRGRDRTAAVENALERFGLGDAGRRPIRTYSGGMRRRLDLAGALLHSPDVLFLDEPTTGLDAHSRRALWDEVRRLRDRGSAVFLTTQYLEEADELAHRVAILDRGTIAAEGTPAELRRRLGGVGLVVNLMKGSTGARAVVLPDGTVVPADADGRVHIPVADTDDAIDVLAYIRSMWSIQAARIESPTLEDVFLDVTGRGVSDAPPVLDPAA